MTNRSTGYSSLALVNAKTPNFTTDLALVPSSHSKRAAELAQQVVEARDDARNHRELANSAYKAAADAHHRVKIF